MRDVPRPAPQNVSGADKANSDSEPNQRRDLLRILARGEHKETHQRRDQQRVDPREDKALKHQQQEKLERVHTPNEKEISHGRVSWQTR